MLDTSNWPQTSLDVLKDIHLDPKNVRLENANAKVEADIIEDLFANEDTMALVEEICKIGYLTHEIPVVLERNGKCIVVEGNRRLAALKALQNPILASKYSARIRSIRPSTSTLKALSKIKVMVAPSQDEADQLVAAIHTGNLRRRWSPARQAAFFQAQIDSGKTLQELLERYPTINVKKFVFRARVINLFKSLEYGDPELRDFIKTKKWAKGLSTLSRIYESATFISLTGLRMNPEGQIEKSISDAAFKEVATAIVQGMYDENINTRTLNSTSSIRYHQLMEEIRHIIHQDDSEASDAQDETLTKSSTANNKGPSPEGRNRNDFGRNDGNSNQTSGRNKASGNPDGSSNQAASGPSNPPASKPKKKKQKYIELGHISVPVSYPTALKSLLGELSTIDVQKFPNATFLLLRAALEKSIKSYAEVKGFDIKSAGYGQNGRVQLGHTLDWLLDHVKNNGPTHLVQVVNSVRTGRLTSYHMTKDSLDAVNHNHHFGVDPDQAFATWNSIDPIMRYVINP